MKLCFAFLLLGLTVHISLGLTPVPAALPANAKATFVQWLDYDNDGRPDLLLAGTRLFHNESEPGIIRLRETTKEAGLQDGGQSLCYDFDNDGWTDIVTTKHLWRNRGDGTFEDVAKERQFSPHAKTMTMAAGDLDGDGLPDLFLPMGEDWNNGNPRYYPAQLWMNSATGAWKESARSAKINSCSYGRGALILDIDGDGKQDIFVANYRLQPNFLWMNHSRKGKLRFEDEARQRGVRGQYDPRRYRDKKTRGLYGPTFGHCIGACWLDFDNDGLPDLLVSNLAHKYVGPTSAGGYDIRGYVCDDSAFYRNLGKSWKDWRAQLGIPTKPIGGNDVFQGDELWSGCAAADFDNDGYEDVFIHQVYDLDYAKALLFHNEGGKSFRDVAEQEGISLIDSYCGAWADIDGDGWVDLIAGGRPAKGQPGTLVVFRNEGTKSEHSWLKLALRAGKRGSALGAIARIKINGQTLTRICNAGSGTMGQQNDPALHFGLGKTTEAPIVTVTWPDGHTTTHETKLRGTTVIQND